MDKVTNGQEVSCSQAAGKNSFEVKEVRSTLITVKND